MATKKAVKQFGKYAKKINKKRTAKDKAINQLMQIHFLLEDWYKQYMKELKIKKKTN